MKQKQYSLILFLLLSFNLIYSTQYTSLLKNSSINFSVKHFLFLKAQGSFENFSGKIKWDPNNLNKSIFNGTIDVKSIQTGTKKYNSLLLSNQFLDNKTYPKITFKSTSIKFISNSKYLITGILSAKGISKKITETIKLIPVANKNQFNLITTLHIDRRDFKIATQYPWPLLDNIVKIHLNIILGKK